MYPNQQQQQYQQYGQQQNQGYPQQQQMQQQQQQMQQMPQQQYPQVQQQQMYQQPGQQQQQVNYGYQADPNAQFQQQQQQQQYQMMQNNQGGIQMTNIDPYQQAAAQQQMSQPVMQQQEVQQEQNSSYPVLLTQEQQYGNQPSVGGAATDPNNFPVGQNDPNAAVTGGLAAKVAMQLKNDNDGWEKGRAHTCQFFNEDGKRCEEIAPFKCGATILCQEIGCKPEGKTDETSRFCAKHRGDFMFLFLKKLRISADGGNEKTDYLCQDHARLANLRAGWIFGIPLAILVIGAIACLVFDIIWIGQGINDTTFDMTLEPYVSDLR